MGIVTNADIDEALRRLRAEAGGHEPYGPAVYGRACEVMAERLAAELSVCEADYAEAVRALDRVRRQHTECEDCGYSCPRSEAGCCNDGTGDVCDCGADSHNAIIDAVLSAPHARRVLEVKK